MEKRNGSCVKADCVTHAKIDRVIHAKVDDRLYRKINKYCSDNLIGTSYFVRRLILNFFNSKGQS